MTPVHWEGEKVKAKVLRAAKHGVNEVMKDCVNWAKRNHKNLAGAPVTLDGVQGWKNITATAEGAIGIARFATEQGAYVVGVWGDTQGVEYMYWLEVYHGAALRTAADLHYKTLPTKIREAMT